MRSAIAAVVVGTVASMNGPPPVTELDLTKYVGLWYQAYSSQSVVNFPEFGAKCVTAEYGVASDGAAVTVKNTVTLLGRRVSVNGIAAQNPDVIGVFQAAIGAPGFPVTKIPTYTPGNFDNYLIAAVGPQVDGQYDWAVVSDERQETLYVLTRDLAKFEQYEEQVLKLCQDLGFTADNIKPVKSYQENCNYSEQNTMVASVSPMSNTGPPPVTELDLTKYVGLWYQAYSSQSVVAFPEFGAKCVTAEYGVASDGAAVTVKNTVTLLGRRVSVNGIAAQNPDVIGVFQADIGAPGFPVTKIPTYTPGNFDNYLIAAVGPQVDGKYDWAVVSDERQETLYVLTRDLAKFEQYEEEVLKLCEDLGFTSDNIKPIKSYQENCNYSEQDTMIV